MNSTAPTTASDPMIDQHVRNQMSLMAWVMTFLCGWVMFLSAYVCVACHRAEANDTATTKTTAVTARH
jgi:heme/copper-type cytochrome/quinol oxidase subunit 2